MLTTLCKANIESLQLVSHKIDALATGADTVSQLLYQDEGITGTLLSHDIELLNTAQIKGNIDTLYSKYHKAFDQVGLSFEIICFSNNGFTYSTEPYSEEDFARFQTYAWFKKYKALKIINYTVSHFNSYYDSSDIGFAIVKNLFNVNGTYSGSIIVYVPEEILCATYSDLVTSTTQFYLLDDQSVIISSNNKNAIGTTPTYLSDYRFVRSNNDYSTYINTEGISCFSAKYHSPTTGWMFYKQIPLHTVYAPIRAVAYKIIFVAFICYLISIYVTIFIADKISAPLQAICDDMGTSISNRFAKIHTPTKLKEVIQIESCYNHLSDEINILLEDIRKSEKRINEANFNFLKAQINPHFLYNTLFSVKCTIAMNDPDCACKMITILISLLRNSISSNKNENSLLDESIIIEQYVNLQNLRYNGIIHYSIDLPEKLTTFLIPRFIIQPLIENIFLHALPLDGSDIELVARFYITDNDLIIEVCDTGMGFSQEELTKVLTNHDSHPHTSHIGLWNIQERIHLIYGESYGISIREDSYFSTVIHICLPQHYEEV